MRLPVPYDGCDASHNVDFSKRAPPSGSAWEVAVIFLKLGFSSFGGPIAHVGYYHREFVERRSWLSAEHFSQLFALCQFLPGAASSQLCYSIGLLRAGWYGGMAAFLAFTLPSALLLYAFALFHSHLDNVWGQATVHGLKLVAVVVVAQGVSSMARTMAPDRPRAIMAAIAAGLVAISGNSVLMQLAIVSGGAALGPWLCHKVVSHNDEKFVVHYGRRLGGILLGVFTILLIMALMVAPHMPLMGQVAGVFYRTGALVFGGGHVVLPLLRQTMVDPGWMSDSTFLAGYGAAQAVPGPMLAVASFLGNKINSGQGGAVGATIGLIAIFLPGMLLISGVLPFWCALREHNRASQLLAGVNAVVVGLLVAALYNPLWVSAVHDAKDFAIALIGLTLLVTLRWPPLAIVVWCIGAALARTMAI